MQKLILKPYMRYILLVFVVIIILLTGDNPPVSKIYILPVKNSIKMGSLSGNVNLTLGVKNILSDCGLIITNRKKIEDKFLKTRLKNNI